MAQRLVPADPEFLDTAPWRFDVSGELDVPPDEAFAAFADNEGWAHWFRRCKECRSTSSPPGGIGSTRFISVNGLKVNERFILWEPGRVWGFTVVDMNLPIARRMAERATFAELPGGRTRVDYRIAIEPRRWAVVLRVALARGLRPAFAKSFATLDRRLAQRDGRRFPGEGTGP